MGMKHHIKENLKAMNNDDLRAALRGYCQKHDQDGTDKLEEFAAGLLFAEWLNRQGEQDSITGDQELDRLMQRFQLTHPD